MSRLSITYDKIDPFAKPCVEFTVHMVAMRDVGWPAPRRFDVTVAAADIACETRPLGSFIRALVDSLPTTSADRVTGVTVRWRGPAAGSAMVRGGILCLDLLDTEHVDDLLSSRSGVGAHVKEWFDAEARKVCGLCRDQMEEARTGRRCRSCDHPEPKLTGGFEAERYPDWREAGDEGRP